MTPEALPGGVTFGLLKIVFGVWKNNFGMTTPGSGSVGGTSVPEPTTLVMALLVLAGCGALRRKK